MTSTAAPPLTEAAPNRAEMTDWHLAWYRAQQFNRELDRQLGRAYLGIVGAFVLGLAIGWWFL